MFILSSSDMFELKQLWCILHGEFDCDRSIAASSEESREARSRLLKLTGLRVIIADKSENLSDL